MNDHELTSRYPELSGLDDAGQALLAQAHRVELSAETVIFRHGDRCDHFVMLVSGHVKVVARSPAGRELLLYRINHQGTCVLTTSCLLGNEHYPAEGIAETDVVAYLLPRTVFQQALDQSPVLRAFIFDSYAKRLAGLIHLVQVVSFESVEQRIIGHLLQRADADGVVKESHQRIADELGTAREVVSRKLQALAQQGLLELGRGKVILVDAEGLKNFHPDAGLM